MITESRKEDLKKLESRLGCKFNDLSLIHTSLIHSSYVNENRDYGLSDNERLEFLGDSVLQLSVSKMLYERFPDFSEGDLTKARASIVTEQSLSRAARNFGLGGYLMLGRGEDASGGRDKDSILANTLEAIIAALFLDQGYDGIQKIIKEILDPMLDNMESDPFKHDYKSRLQELSHEIFHSIPVYRVASTQGPDHDKTFDVEVKVNNVIVAGGSGKSKKEAEQQAARRALEIVLQGSDSKSP